MNDVEDGLRDVFRAVAQTFSSEEIRPMGIRPEAPAYSRWRRPRVRRGLRVRGVLLPALAAAAVVLVVLGAVVAVPRLLRAGGQLPDGPLDSSARSTWPIPGYRAPSAPAPRYMVVVSDAGGGHPLSVQLAATGRVLALVNPPRAGIQWAAVAATADNRTFVVAAQTAFDIMSSRNCDIRLYRLELAADGTLASLSPLAVPELPGQLGRGSTLAASADGRTVAYASYSCDDTDPAETIGVVNTATAKTAAWTTSHSKYPGSLSLSADGRLLAFAYLTQSSPADVQSSAWVLRTDSAPGPVQQRGRAILRTPHALQGGPQVDSVAISADGTIMFVITETNHGSSLASDTLAAYRIATGRLLATLHTFPAVGVSPCSVSATPDAGHLILWDIFVAHTARVDLATGKIQNFHDISANSIIPTTATGSLSPTGIAW